MEKQELLKVKEIFERMTGESVRGICVQGARMKGVADQAAEHDIFIVVSKSFEQYAGVNIHGLDRYAELQIERFDSRRTYQHVATRVGMELGIGVSFSVYDLRAMFRGLVEYNPFTVVVIEEMMRSGHHDLPELARLLPKLHNVKLYVKEYLSAAVKNISSAREDLRENVAFRSEKRFVFALWNLYMAAAILHGVKTPNTDPQNSLQVDITSLFNALKDSGIDLKYPTGICVEMEDIFIERATRKMGVPITPLEEEDFNDILEFYDSLKADLDKVEDEQINNAKVLQEANKVLLSILTRINIDEMRAMIEEYEQAELA